MAGVVELPGDKSISHRYAILAALAEGRSEIFNYATAADCRSTLECLRRLGAEIDATRERVRITGSGLDGLKAPKRALDAENSGSTMRMLSGLLVENSRMTFSARCTFGCSSHDVSSGVSGLAVVISPESSRFPARTRFSISNRFSFRVVVRGKSSCQIS